MSESTATSQDRHTALTQEVRLPCLNDFLQSSTMTPAAMNKVADSHLRLLKKVHVARELAHIMQAHGPYLEGVRIHAMSQYNWALKKSLELVWKPDAPSKTMRAAEKMMGTLRSSVGFTKEISDNLLPSSGNGAMVSSSDTLDFMKALQVDPQILSLLKQQQLESALPQTDNARTQPRM